MISLVFAVRDNAVEAYMQPFCAPTKGAAIRSFSDAANDPQSMVFKHSEDHVLFHVGHYDDQTGIVTPLDAPVSLGVAIEFKESSYVKEA